MLAALKHMDSNESAVVLASSIKAIIKLLTNIAKRPQDKKHRKVRMANMMIRKFVSEVNGAMALLQAVGFEQSAMGVKKVEYLWMEKVDESKLARSIQLLKDKLAEVTQKVEKEKEPEPQDEDEEEVEEVQRGHACADGCGYLAEDDMDGYCSVCFDRRYYGVVPLSLPIYYDGEGCYYAEASPDGEALGESQVIFLANGEIVAPHHCINDCGFFGLTFMGMCSNCWQNETHTEERQKDWRQRIATARVKLEALRRFWSGKCTHSYLKSVADDILLHAPDIAK